MPKTDYFPEPEDEKFKVRTDSLRRVVNFENGATATIDQTGLRLWTIKWKNYKSPTDLSGSWSTIDKAEEKLGRYIEAKKLAVKSYSPRFIEHDGKTFIESEISYFSKTEEYERAPKV